MQSISSHIRPRLVIAGTHSGAGKTSVVTAVLAALSKQRCVAPFKVGPDYIDPAFHAHVTGKPSRNLDSWLLDAATVRSLFARNAPEQGIAVIEGVMGLFDGKASAHEGSTAHVAELLEAPVALVINSQGLSRSAAALVSGYMHFHPGVRVAGVICNRIKTDRQYALIKESVEEYCGIPCLGYLPEDERYALHSRHLGLVPAGEVAGLDRKIAALGEAAEKYLDLPALAALADAAPPLSAEPLQLPTRSFSVRIAVARDSAFSFYYQDNLDLLTALGAELVFFSPMRDASLPENIQGAYFGGGFPEVFAQTLSDNASMRSSVAAAVDGGLPILAECGGMAYLCRSLTDGHGAEFAMTGVFPESVVMTEKLQQFGYAEAEFTRDTILGETSRRFRIHEFHYSRLYPEPEEPCLLLRKSETLLWHGGMVRNNVFAAYPHIHFFTDTGLAVNFLQACAENAR
ncbi:MAG: Cobyrinate a,c-diamide synthase [Desulfovibrio sp.]